MKRATDNPCAEEHVWKKHARVTKQVKQCGECRRKAISYYRQELYKLVKPQTPGIYGTLRGNTSTCKRGHDKATYEVRYTQTSGYSSRRCRECVRLTTHAWRKGITIEELIESLA
jgi:hypothetical protein